MIGEEDPLYKWHPNPFISGPSYGEIINFVCEILWYYHSNDPFGQKFSKIPFVKVFFGLFNHLI